MRDRSLQASSSARPSTNQGGSPNRRDRRSRRLNRLVPSKRRGLRHESLEKRELLAAEIGASVASESYGHAHPIFALGTSPEQIAAAQDRFGLHSNDENSLSSSIIVNPNRRWVNTALGNSPNIGDTSAVTWSIVPDGTQILNPNTGAVDGTSNLVAFMDGIYGGAGTSVITDKPWFPIFDAAYTRWSDVSGLTMQYEPNDDGAPATAGGAAGVGVLNVRGDMRIAGMDIDGNSGVLAFNYFPNANGLSGADGDMVIDTNDNFYANNADGANGPNRALHNVLTHEVGHGIGLSHVEPVNQTKLMEPFISTAYRGPQEDDIWNSHILYGDALEPNDDLGTAIDFGVVRNEVRSISGVSIDNGLSTSPDEDVDLYRFEVLTPTGASIDLTPTGTQYDEGPQGGTASPIDRLRESDLGFRLLDVDGNVLTTVNDAGLGIAESVTEFDLDEAGTYFVEVFGSNLNPQLYDLSLRIGRTFDFARSDGALRLLSVSPTPDVLFERDGLNLLEESPAELLLRFSSDEGIDETTLAQGIRVSDAGRDGVLGTPDDIIITPGWIGLDSASGREVAMRFAQPLGDGRYRVEVFGEDIPAENIFAVRKTDGDTFDPAESGSDRDIIDFELELGARVVAVVPQPTERDAAGTLTQQRDSVHVYFDDDDLFAGGGTTSLVDPNFYQLIRTEDTVENTDDTAAVPVSVVAVPFDTQTIPDPLDPDATIDVQVRVNRVELTFAGDLADLPGGGTFRLKVGSSDPVATTSTPPQITAAVVASDPGATFAAAEVLADFGTTPSLRISESIIDTGLPFDFPSGSDEPGHRDIAEQVHVNNGPDSDGGIQVLEYNFAFDRSYGTDSAGRDLFTSINPQQVQRIREVFEIYSQQLGVSFVETVGGGTTVVVGDLFPNGVESGPGGVIGVASSALAIMDSAENWYNGYGVGTTGISFFETALHELGHSIGLGHSYELPGGTIMGNEDAYAGSSREWRYPGDHDVVHGQHLYRPDNRDVDLYRFDVNESGVLAAETFAERRQGGSLLDTTMTLYQDTLDGPVIIAQNDDLFGSDSAISLRLEPGTYFVGVTAAGNEDFDPLVDGTGSGGESQGDYELLLNFKPDATSSILDAAGTPIDGDADGIAGGSFDFWFKANDIGDTLFVDAAAATDGDGSLATPYREIKTALAAATPGQIVRIVGNAGDDGVVGLPNDNFSGNDDNVAYEIGRIRQLNQELSDGSNLIVPQGVTVMIDAGAVLKMLESRVAVGSGEAGVDASLGALQVLGTPHLPVFFTSHNDPGAGEQRNPLSVPPRAGDWGGIDIRNGSDRAEGRFDLERQGIFLNYVGQTDMRYGGGVVVIEGQSVPISPIRLDAARPTLIGNDITLSSDAAISADPASFEEDTFTNLRYQRFADFVPDYDRVGPVMYGNTLTNNSINGVLVRIDTPSGGSKETLSVPGRFDDTEVVHVLGDNLIVQGNPGGMLQATVPDPLTLVTLGTTVAAPGEGLTAGDYVYALSYVDRYGVETTISSPTAVITVSDGDAVDVSNLSAAPTEFIARRLYRAVAGGGDYRFVADLNRSDSTYVDSTDDVSANVTPINNPVDAYRARPDARLVVDAGVVVKSTRVRIETGFGADVIAEGNEARPVIFTSRTDDRYGAGGTFDTTANGDSVGTAGDWAGIFANPYSRISLDNAVVAFAGGESEVEGTSVGFNAIGLLQADARITDTLFEQNAGGLSGNDQFRIGRGPNENAVIHIVGSQPILVGNTFIGTAGSNTAAISINVNAMTGQPLDDVGRQTGVIDLQITPPGNFGPLIHGNVLSAEPIIVQGNRVLSEGIAGLRIRPETLNTGVVFDDTDITHVVSGEIIVPDLHTYGGLRLQSRSDESLVVKFTNGSALVADGRALDIDDRIGGSIQVIGSPGFPVVLTSIDDDSVGAGFDPLGRFFTDTNANGPTNASPGSWRGIELLEFSNDRNVETIIEQEGSIGSTGDRNGSTGTAETLGLLAAGEKSSDENLRLGFSVFGAIASAGDQDVYSFRATAGTTAWLDVDRTHASLDSVIELVSGDGTVLARSGDSHLETAAGVIDFAGAGVVALPMRQSPYAPTNSINGSYQDFYSLNPLDAGMRVQLPGPAGVQQEYFVRVTGANGSSGVYELQTRLQETDEFAGSTVRYSDIRFAETGILARGVPGHSPLTGEGTSNGTSVVDLGNLANTDRAAISVSGNLTAEDEPNRYSFRIERDSVQGGGTTVSLSATFDIDYADGVGRPDTSLLLYYRGVDGSDAPRLVMMAEDSNIASDQPGPGNGSDIDDLSRGSLGTRDAFLGTVELPAGDYDLVVTSKAQIPAELDQYFVASPSNPNIRLEPVTSTIRIAQDRFGDDEIPNLTFAGLYEPVQDVVFQGEDNAIPFTLGDVNLFVAGQGNNNGGASTTRLFGVNPQIGDTEAVIGTDFTHLGAIAMHPDGFLFGSASGAQGAVDTDGNTGGFFQIDDATGALTNVGNSGIVTFDTYDANLNDANTTPAINVALSNGGQNGDGMNFDALAYHIRGGNDNELRFYGVAQRGNGTQTFERAIIDANGDVVGTSTIPATNYVYRLDPTTGAVINARTTGDTSDRAGDDRTEGAGTDKIEIGRIAVPGTDIGLVTGLTNAAGSFYAVTNSGFLIRIPEASFGDNSGTRTGQSQDIGEVVTQIGGGIDFTGLTTGPRNLADYNNLLFATDSAGSVHAFDTDGNLVDVLGLGTDSVATAASGPTGLAFSTLDVNLWHRTEQRSGDDGHGILASTDGSRDAASGQRSLYFGFDADANVAENSQSGDWQNESIPERSVGNYDFPGGSQGGVQSYGIDLTGYASEDQPMLYFNYLLDVEDVNAIRDETGQARDSFRVYVSSAGDRDWKLVATNNTQMELNGNSVPHDVNNNDYTDGEDEFDIDRSGFVDDLNQYQIVQPLYDVADWRQARISLSPWAGDRDVRVRFDFNTAGEPEVNALELRAGGPQDILQTGETVFQLSDVSNDIATFAFDFGDVLQLPGGAAIQHASTIELVDRGTGTATAYTFNDVAIDPTDSPTTVLYSADMTGAEVRTAFAAKLAIAFDVDLDPVVNNRIAAKSSESVTLTGFDDGVIVARSVADPSVTQVVDVALDMDLAEVRDAIQLAIATRYQSGQPEVPGSVPVSLSPYQVFGDTVRVFGFNAVDAGPLATFGGYSATGSITLPGSESGVYGTTAENGFGNNALNASRVAADRGLNNTGNGVFIDDVIIGFAERGEMVLTQNAGNDLSNNPLFELITADEDTRVSEIAVGGYQLEVRLSVEYGEPADASATNTSASFGGQELLSAYDTNMPHDALIGLRFVEQIVDPFFGLVDEIPITGADIRDGATVTISDGVNQINFEFNDASNPAVVSTVVSGSVPVLFTSSMDSNQVAGALRDAINSPEVQAFFLVSASSPDGGDTPGQSNGNAILLHGPAAGDLNGSLTFSDPVDLPLQVQQFGVDVLPSYLEPNSGLPIFPFYWGAPLTGDANIDRAQGQVILHNNTIQDSSNFGISITAGLRDRSDVTDLASTDLPRPGSTRNFITPNSDNLAPGVVAMNNVLVANQQGGILVQGDSLSPVPAPDIFARLLNNTVYGTGGSDSGIRIDAGAAPTLVNNAVVNLGTGINMNGANGAIEIFNTLYAGNGTNSTRPLEASALTPANADVFVDPATRNFYPIALSALIDGGDDSILDRFNLQSLRESLGIAPSPIVAPARDITGQRRVDDPDVTGSGTGSNVFIDIGAFDRSDFRGPTALLVDPTDNGSDGVDVDLQETYVRLADGTLDQFVIKLSEFEGTGTDDLSVLEQTVVISENGRRLIPGVDYVFGYSASSNTIVLTPTSGLWSQDSAFEITLNNRDRIVAQMSNGLGVFDGDQFTVTDDAGTTETFEFDSGIVLRVDGTVADGDLIRYQTGPITIQFELDSDGSVAPATTFAIPFNATDSNEDIAAKIGLVLSQSGFGLDDARDIENAGVFVGGQVGDQIDLVSAGMSQTGQPGVSAGAIAIPFVPSASYTADTMAGQVIAAITDSGLTTTVFAPGGGTIWLDQTTFVTGLESGDITAIRDLAGNNLEPNRANRETQFTILMPNVDLDFGDAPAISGYRTSLAQNGARHTVGGSRTPRLGSLIDTESDALASDDGVSPLAVSVSAGFDSVVIGANEIVVSVGSTPAAGDRITLDVDGLLYEFELVLAGNPASSAVPVLYVPDEPSEVLTQRLVAIVRDTLADASPEVSVQYARDTSTFNLVSLDDEEGVKIGSVDVSGNSLDGVFFNPSTGELLSFLNPLAGLGSELLVDTTGGGLLDGWVDFNADGDFLDPGEQILANEPVFDGLNSLIVHTPRNTVAGNGLARTWARFRLSNTGNTLPTGVAVGGEVEDHNVLIAAVDLPSPSDDTYAVDEDTTLVTTVIDGVGANDVAPATIAGLQYELDQSTGNGVLTFNADGTFNYVPAEDFYGEDFFTYRITGVVTVDGVEIPIRSADHGTVQIIVNPVNDAPFAPTLDFITTEPSDTLTAMPLIMTRDQLLAAALPQDDADARFSPWDEKEQSLHVVQIGIEDAAGGINPLVSTADPFTAVDGTYTSVSYVDGTLSGTITATVVGGEVDQVEYVPADDYNRDNPQIGGLASFDGFTFTIADDGATTLPNGDPATQAPDPKLNTGVVRIEVKPSNDSPTSNDETIDAVSLGINEDVTSTIPAALLLANDFAGNSTTDDESLALGGNDGALQILTDANLPAGMATLLPVFPITTARGGIVTLDPSGDLSYTPPRDYYGIDSFSYGVVDQGIDEAVDGTRSVNSKVSFATVTFDVQPVNDAPATTDKSFVTLEDTTITITADELLVDSVAHGDALRPAPFNEDIQGLQIVALTASGVTIDANTAAGSYATDHGSISASFNADGSLSSVDYTPDLDFNADNPLNGVDRSLDLFVFTISDDGVIEYPDGSTRLIAPATYDAIATTLVTPQNDAPAAGDDFVGLDSADWNNFFGGVGPVPTEDVAMQIPVAFFLGNDFAGPATAADERLGTNNNDGSVSILPGTYRTSLGSTVIVTGGIAIYTPAADVYGDDLFVYDLVDSGVDESVENRRSQNSLVGQGQVTFALEPVNDVPNGRELALIPIESGEVGETVVYSFTAADVIRRGPGANDDDFAGTADPSLIDPYNESAQTLEIIEIRTSDSQVASRATLAAGSDTMTLTTPQGGTLEVTFAGDFFASGVYTPVNGDYNSRTPFSTPDEFQYILVDDGLTPDPDGGPDVLLPPQMSALIDGGFAVQFTNDAPEFTSQPVVDVLERDDNGAAVIADWATDIRPGPITALDELQRENVSFVLVESESTIPAGLFGRLPTVSNDGRLSVYPARDAIGTAVLVFDAVDNDPRDSSFQSKSTRTSVTVNVHAVNDPPRLRPEVLNTGVQFSSDDAYAIANDGVITYTLPEDNTSPTGDAQSYDFPIRGDAARIGVLDVFSAGPDNEIGNVEGGNQVISLLSTFPISTSLGGRVERIDTGGTSVLRYFPPTDVNNTDGVVDTFEYLVGDESVGNEETYSLNQNRLVNDQRSTLNRVAFDLTPVNDRPEFVIETLDVESVEDGNEVTVPDFASSILAGPSSAGDENAPDAGQVVSFDVTAVGFDASALFSTQPTISADGSLIYQSAPDTFGVFAFDVTLTDDGLGNNTSNRGDLNTSLAQQITLTVLPQNDAPVRNTQTELSFDLLEDQSIDIPLMGSGTNRGLFDVFDVGPANEAASSPIAGGSQSLSLADPIPSTSLNGGTLELVNEGGVDFLRYTPRADHNGTDSFIYSVIDNGVSIDAGTDQTVLDDFLTATATVSFNLTAVNDAPRFSSILDVTTREDGPAVALPGWATSVLASARTATDEINGTGTVPAQSLEFVFTQVSGPSDLFSVAPSASISGSVATLNFATNPDAFGDVVFDVYLRDDGPSDNSIGDAFESDVQTFTISITAENDPPTFTTGGDVSVTEDSGPYSEGWATNVSVGPENEAATGQTLTFEVITPSESTELFEVLPAVDPDGGLTFTPAADASGQALVNVRAVDSDGGESPLVSFTITVVEVSDPPVANDDSIVTDEDTVLVIEAADLLANDTDADLATNTMERLTIFADTTLVTSQGATLTFDATSQSFVYDATSSIALQQLTEGETVTDTFTYEIEDFDGETPRPSANVTLTVGGINDAPNVGDDNVALNPSGPTLIRVLDNDSDVDGSIDRSSIVITDEPLEGFVTILADGTLTYTRDSNSTGVDGFRYTVADNNGQQSVQAVVRIGEGPFAIDVQAGTSRNRPVQIDLTSGVSGGATIDPNSVVIVDGPNNGTLELGDDATLIFTPNADFTGRDAFTFTVADINGLRSNESTVNLRVVNSNLQNPVQFSDVNADGNVTAFDSLLIINRLNRAGNEPSVPVMPDDVGPNYFDRNGDMTISAFDALLVINELNRNSRSQDGGGEGEMITTSSAAIATGQMIVTPLSDVVSDRDDESDFAATDSFPAASDVADETQTSASSFTAENTDVAFEAAIDLIASEVDSDEKQVASLTAQIDELMSDLI